MGNLKNNERDINKLKRKIKAISAEIAETVSVTDSDKIAHAIKHLVAERDARKKELEDLEAKQSADTGENFTQVATEQMRKLIEDNDLYYVSQGKGVWLRYLNESWVPCTSASLKTQYQILNEKEIYTIFDDILVAQGRKKDMRTYSWKQTPDNVLNMLRWKFCDPSPGATEYHPVFDWLFSGIGGEKQDNIDHLQKLFLCKYLYPENYMLPALVLNDQGGSGKSFLSEVFAPSLFGANRVLGNTSANKVLGKFNSQLLGMAYVFINEAVEDKVDNNALKRIIMSQDLEVEPKGEPAYQAENTAMYVLAGNSVMGTVRLEGNKTDRRFSIMMGNRPLDLIVGEHMKMNKEDADFWMRTEGKRIVSDPYEMGRWITCMIAKHGDVKYVQAHQAQDYENTITVQKSLHTEVFEAVFNDIDFKFIKTETLYGIYDYYAKRRGIGKMSSPKVKQHAIQWLKQNRPEIVLHNSILLQGMSGRAVARGFADANTVRVKNTDLHYIEEVNGQITRVFDI